jgi:hypothetical protein
VLLLILALWWLLRKLDLLPSFRKMFAPKEVVIDQTPVVISQIRPLAQLVTITAYTEVAADSTMPASVGERLRDVLNPFSFEVHTNRQLVIVGKVTIHVGVDLQKLRPEDISIQGDSISIQLPNAEILDAILNPSGTDIFLEEGKWDNNTVTNLKTTLQHKAIEDVKSRGVLYQAEERAKAVLTNFLLAAGYRKVTVQKGRLG